MGLQLLLASQRLRQRRAVPVLTIPIHPSPLQRRPLTNFHLGRERQLLARELRHRRALRLQRAGRLLRGALVVHAAQ